MKIFCTGICVFLDGEQTTRTESPRDGDETGERRADKSKSSKLIIKSCLPLSLSNDYIVYSPQHPCFDSQLQEKSALEETLDQSQQNLEDSKLYINQLRQKHRDEKKDRAM